MINRLELDRVDSSHACTCTHNFVNYNRFVYELEKKMLSKYKRIDIESSFWNIKFCWYLKSKAQPNPQIKGNNQVDNIQSLFSTHFKHIFHITIKKCKLPSLWHRETFTTSVKLKINLHVCIVLFLMADLLFYRLILKVLEL